MELVVVVVVVGGSRRRRERDWIGGKDTIMRLSVLLDEALSNVGK